jgi:hypothetical protein
MSVREPSLEGSVWVSPWLDCGDATEHGDFEGVDCDEVEIVAHDSILTYDSIWFK